MTNIDPTLEKLWALPTALLSCIPEPYLSVNCIDHDGEIVSWIRINIAHALISSKPLGPEKIEKLERILQTAANLWNKVKEQKPHETHPDNPVTRRSCRRVPGTAR